MPDLLVIFLDNIGHVLFDQRKAFIYADNRQGPQVENPGLFVWSMDFDSLQQWQGIQSSELYRKIQETSIQVVDQQISKGTSPLRLPTIWSANKHEVDAATQAAITELAFFKVTSKTLSIEEAKKEVEDGLADISKAVKKFGSAKGAAIGWITTPSGETILHGVFGYDSLGDHLQWRQHPEHAKAGVAFLELNKNGILLVPDVRVAGVDPEKGYFHVHFLR